MRKNGLLSAAIATCTLATLVVLPGSAEATTSPGCLFVVNVAANDALNMRSRPSASSRIVDVLVPGNHGIIHLDAPCEPLSRPWPSRWCPVSHYDGGRVTRGWVKARYVRDSECP